MRGGSNTDCNVTGHNCARIGATPKAIGATDEMWKILLLTEHPLKRL